MNITHLHVVNYRGLKDVSLPLSRFSCITGENNGGKSSVLQSLSLFLSGSSLKASDYFDPAREITITVKFSEITDADLGLLADEHRDRIASLIVDDGLTLVRQYGTDGRSQLGYLGLVPKDPRFSAENVANLTTGKRGNELKQAVLNVFPELESQVTGTITQTAAKELIQQFSTNLPDADKETRFVPLPTGLDKSIIPMLPERIYIPAVKDLTDDTKTSESSSFGKILAIVTKTIEPLLSEEKDLFDKLSKKLTRLVGKDGEIEDNRLQQIRNIEQTIERYVRESFASVSLEIEIPPPEIKSLLSTARIVADDGVKGPLELKGDGLRRAVVFSILRTYVELARIAGNVNGQNTGTQRGYLLLFEEPELFLHPYAQRILFDALGVFSKNNHVVVTTHSPIFLGPESTATFIRLSKTTESNGERPHTKPCHVDLSGMTPRDEFQIICYENNTAAFFAKRIVLVEGDSDLIVFPHIAETLNQDWNCRFKSVAFVRVGGKGSIARYRNFFDRFAVPVFVITDLDSLDDDFDKLQPTDEAKKLRNELIQKADAVIAATEAAISVSTDEIKRAQARPEIRRLWEDVKTAKQAYDRDKSKLADLEAAVEAFFAWEKKHIRRECIRLAAQDDLKSIKLALIWELRKKGVFVLECGALDDYYPPDVTGPDKLSKAQSFKNKYCTRDLILSLSPQQIHLTEEITSSEFEFICSSIFD